VDPLKIASQAAPRLDPRRNSNCGKANEFFRFSTIQQSSAKPLPDLIHAIFSTIQRLNSRYRGDGGRFITFDDHRRRIPPREHLTKVPLWAVRTFSTHWSVFHTSYPCPLVDIQEGGFKSRASFVRPVTPVQYPAVFWCLVRWFTGYQEI
jgi:hypothetical protein